MTTTSTTAQPATQTLDAPGATLTYDVRRNDQTTEPVLFLIGSPMGAAGFGTLASHFPDRTVLTYDPRGTERSTKADPTTPSTPADHADDLHRIIGQVGGPVDLFANSGGAVNALALVTAHPEDVRILVAHEPPLAAILPDSENAKAAVRAIQSSYQTGGFGAGMAHFMAVTAHRGPFPDDFASQPAPDPAMFGMPTEDDGRRDDPLLSGTAAGITAYRPDAAALKAAPTRVVIGVGEESRNTITGRTSVAAAEALGQEAVEFGVTLHEVLDA